MSSDEKNFAEGLGFAKLFWIFVIGSIFGALYEEILTCVQTLFRTGTFEWVLRRGVIYGPFSPIYGAGAVLMALLLVKNKKSWHQTYCYAALLGGGFEYLVSVLQEIFIGTTSWNYSHQFLNLHGRTTIPLMLVWGFLGLLFVDAIYPWIDHMLKKIPNDIGKRVTTIFAIFLALDMLISWTALFRQTLRRNHIPPLTPVGEFYDRVYTDEFLSRYFTNMVPSKRKR